MSDAPRELQRRYARKDDARSTAFDPSTLTLFLHGEAHPPLPIDFDDLNVDDLALV